MEGEPSEIRKGIVFGVVAVGTMAVGIVIVKLVLERSELIEATQMRLVFGTLPLFIQLRDKLSEITDALRPGKHFRVMLPGAFLGSYLAMILWVGGMKYALASVSGVLSQLSTVFTLFFGWWFLGEVISKGKFAGAILAIGGALLIGWSSASGG